MMRKTIALMLALKMLFNPAISQAAYSIPGFYGKVTLPPVAANQLPQVRMNGGIQDAINASVGEAVNGQMTIDQNRSQAIINWDSFDIGANATVYFRQQDANGVAQTGWSALNRIHSQSASYIYGKLKADGKVYLINQNGILFGPGSQVDVHSLTASTLNLHDADFLGGNLRFKAENYQVPASPLPSTYNTNATVANHGIIATKSGGSVYLVAPNVENNGSITTPFGQICLLSALPSTGASDYDVDVTATVPFQSGVMGGTTFNFRDGALSADSGAIKLYGATIEHQGIIRAVTTVNQSGRIELHASDRITTFLGSEISTPISESDDTIVANEDNPFTGGTITMGGLGLAASTTVTDIVLGGQIISPYGNVSLNASNRVLLETGSSIDVSGLWVDRAAGSNLIDVQMNSINLRDDYTQRDGVLQGETVAINPIYGSTIGDISGYLTSAELSARDQSTRGGTIDISVTNGDIILKSGATLNFGGGGFNFAAGNQAVPKLLCGNRVYDFSNAPDWYSYGAVLGSQQVRHAKYGVKEVFKGLYFGGGSAVNDNSTGFSQGSDAGALSLRAANIVLDGSINARATAGDYQIAHTANADDRLLSVAAGLEQPRGGTLNIGDVSTTSDDYRLGEVVLADEVAARNDITVDTPGEQVGSATYLSTEKLSGAGLSSLNIYSNTSVTTTQGSRLTLDQGSSFTVNARRIEHNGDITIHGGSVEFELTDNITSEHYGQINVNPRYELLQERERIYLADGSSIDVSGERVNNLLLNESSGIRDLNYIKGGKISLTDTRELGTEVIFREGAVLDVSGGYGISSSGKVTGGDAGTLELRARTVILDGELRGFSLAGNAGGKIILHASQVNLLDGSPASLLDGSFGAGDDLADVADGQLVGQLTIGDDKFAETGFGRFTLRSYESLGIGDGIEFRPSYVKLATPTAAGGSTQPVLNVTANGASGSGTVVVDPDYVGITSFTARAGDPLYTGTNYFDPANNPAIDPDSYRAIHVSLAESATVAMAPKGSVTFEAPGVVIAGTVTAPAGSITATAGALVSGLDSGDLTITSTGSLTAAGYNEPSTATIAGVAVGPTPVSAGSVNLTAAQGSLILEEGSLVDVSGSAAVENMQASANGVPTAVMVAGRPGSISLSFGQNLQLDGQLNAGSAMDGIQGGALSVKGGETLSLSSELLGKLLTYDDEDNGFDEVTFKSAAILFEEGIRLDLRRKLTLDTPVIMGSGAGEINLSAPWLVLQNTISPAEATVTPDNGIAVLHLEGDWIDIVGGVHAGGFGDINLTAQNSLRLSDRYYSDEATKWHGNFTTPGNITITAGTVYPVYLDDVNSPANFTLSAGKKVTILPVDGASPGPVYSAGGNLTIIGGEGIEQRGVVKSPLGRITLQSEGRIYLADGSITSTAAESSIYYGEMDEDLYWTTTPHSNDAVPVEVTEAPQKNVTLDGDEVIVGDGATIDISGGGDVFSYRFQPGIEGTYDPFLTGERYVIMADRSVTLPGQSVYIAGGYGLEAGTYSLLPEQYAFLPGAMVITATGNTMASGQQMTSREGYPVVGGYFTVQGTDIRSPQMQGFSVRTAADVRNEGHFEMSPDMIAGNGGVFTATATTTVLQGTISARALNGFKGGTLDLSAQEVIVQHGLIDLGDFDFSDFSNSLDEASPLYGKLLISDQTLTDKGLGELRLGSETGTNSVTIGSGSVVNVPVITLSAMDTISTDDTSGIFIEADASLTALAADGSGSVTLKAGEVTIADGATVKAGSSMTIEAGNAVLDGDIGTDHGVTSLISDQVFVVSNNDTDTDRSVSGIYLTEALWNGIGDGLTLTGHEGVTFRGDLALGELQTLTIDTARLAGVGQTGDLNITASGIHLLNSGANTGSSALASTGTVVFSAENIVLGGESSAASQGALLLDGFRSITLNSNGDLTLMGQGALKTGWITSLPGQELVMTGARLVTAPYRDGTGNYQRADFVIDGSHGAVSFAGSAGNAGTSTWAGGRMRMTGDSIRIAGTIELPAGEIDLTAAGATGGIFLESGARILSRGVLAPTAVEGEYTAYSGGIVSLSAANGTVSVNTGAMIDVSAADGGAQGDAGAVFLTAANGDGVLLNGDIYGYSGTGRGGSLLLDSSTVDLTALNNKLQYDSLTETGGFTGQLNIRARTGNMTVADSETIRATNISLTADAGDITVIGALDASGSSTGGLVELNAGNTLTLADGSVIDVHGGDEGGEVWLNAGGVDVDNNPAGLLDFASGATIVASGATADSGGLVHFRTRRTAANDDMMMNYNGSVTGASRIEAEGVRVYRYEDVGSDLTSMLSDADDFITGFTGSPGADVHLLSGIEIRSMGDLSFSGWDLTNYRYGSEPGVLTLRAGGNLTINGNLVDQATPLNDGAGTVLETSTAHPSWGFNLAAGADLTSADTMAVNKGAGKDLIMDNGARIYTEKATIRFSAGNNMNVTDDGSLFAMDSPMISQSISFNLGTYDGAIRGRVGNNLTLNGGVIQSATGDIDISVGGNLSLDFAPGNTSLIGSIRTTGEYSPGAPNTFDENGNPAGYLDYWNYHYGGNIRLSAGNNLITQLSVVDRDTGTTPGWDMVTEDGTGLHWSANYSSFFNPQPLTVTTQGVATMGGGGITLRSGGDVKGQFGAFISGDLRILAGGDLSGRFLVKEGGAMMTAGGEFAPLASAILDGKGREMTPADGSLVELFHGNVDIAAQGSVTLGTVVNPTIASGAFSNTENKLQSNWYLDPGYRDSSVSLSSVNGDVSIIGRTGFYAITSPDLTIYPYLLGILPPTVDVYAGGSIRLLQQSLALAPSPTGTLRLVAGLDIDGGVVNSAGTFRRGVICMSDIDTSRVYGYHNGFDVNTLYDAADLYHALTPVHANDTANPNILAAQGDITNLKLYLPKATSIRAGNDITDINMVWQNVAASDLSSIIAGRNISFTSLAGSDNIIQQGGPGYLLVMAGDTIDLGTTRGIQAVGNTINSMLPDEGSGLFVAAGTSPHLTTEMVASFFPLLRDAGSEYSKLLADGETDKAMQVVETFRTEQIAPLFEDASETASGRINMISSKISTLGTNGDIFVVTGNDINVGKSAIGTSKADSGIFTASGGAINVFAMNDINVNESKIMTFLGGDITVWSDEGDINAGRGSKTAISAAPPKRVPKDSGDLSKGYNLVFSPPSVGSGIRAVTYDPDGVTGPEEAPPAGDIYAFAPKGIIDAGEAGIAGGRVILGASQVLNAQNISFATGSVGVPTGAEGAISLGALAGAGNVTEAAKMGEKSTMSSAREKLAKETSVVDDFLSKYLDVKVIDFETDEGEKEKEDEEKKK